MTKVRVLRPGDEVALEAFLLPLLDTSMFLLGNSRSGGLLDRGERFQGTYAAAFEGDRIVGVAALYWNGSLVLQAPQHLDEVWPTAASAADRGIKRVIGPVAQVQAVANALEITELQIQKDEPENLYSLDLRELIVPDALASGIVQSRKSAQRDIELCTTWRVGYYVELMGECDALELRQTARANVETQMRAILFTGVDNIAAQRAYVALGFRHTGDYRLLYLHEPVWI